MRPDHSEMINDIIEKPDLYLMYNLLLLMLLLLLLLLLLFCQGKVLFTMIMKLSQNCPFVFLCYHNNINITSACAVPQR